jgi:flagellar hook-associated protein 1 FlgK
MTDMLLIAQSGVRTYAKALDVVADNVANAATAGHVRRTATLSAAVLAGAGGPLELDPAGGSGVKLTGIARAIDELRLDTVRRAESGVAALAASDRWLSVVQSTLTGPAGLDGPVTELFAGLADLANDPTAPAVRAAFLARADTVARRFNASAADLARIDRDLQAEAGAEVATLNGLTQGLARINLQLRRATGGSGASVALADERDRLVQRIATIAAVEVTIDARGQAIVRVPDEGGPLLVDGATAKSARIEDGAAGGFELRIGPKGDDEPAALTGGALAGLSTARELLGRARNSLDGLADRVAADFNRVHGEGVDLAGDDGKPLFTTRAAVAEPAGANGGAARIAADLAPGATPGPMNLVFDGTRWTLARDDLSASVTGGFPLSLDGVTVDGAGDARNGDLFRIETVAGARGIALAPLSGREVAAAPRFLADAAPSNLGGAKAELRLGPPALPPAVPPYQLTTLPGGLLELRDAAATLVAAGAVGDWLVGDGFAIRVTGSPADGDLFAVRRNGADSGGNANAVAMLALREAGGAAGTLAEAQDALVTGLSVPLAEIRTRREVARVDRDTAAEALQEASGVDLNTEASEMLRLQQAFSANARIIQTARETFEAILAAAR